MDWDVRSTQSTSDPEVVNGMSESMPGNGENSLYGSSMIFFSFSFSDLCFGRFASESIVRCVSPSFPVDGADAYASVRSFFYLYSNPVTVTYYGGEGRLAFVVSI